MNKNKKNKLRLKEFTLNPVEYAQEKAADYAKEKAEEKFKEVASDYTERAKKLKDLLGSAPTTTPTNSPPPPTAGSGPSMTNLFGGGSSPPSTGAGKSWAFGGGGTGKFETPPETQGAFQSPDAENPSLKQKKYYFQNTGPATSQFMDPDQPTMQPGQQGKWSFGGTPGADQTKIVPYPDMPDIKPCNPKIFNITKRCPNYEIMKGCGGPNVQQVQVQLIRKGIDLSRNKADCRFGPETQEAVKEFQVEMGIPNDGIVDRRTRALLFGKSKQPEEKEANVEGKTVKIKKVQEALELNVFKDVKNLNNRYDQVEKLVFERLVKGCK